MGGIYQAQFLTSPTYVSPPGPSSYSGVIIRRFSTSFTLIIRNQQVWGSNPHAGSIKNGKTIMPLALKR